MAILAVLFRSAFMAVVGYCALQLRPCGVCDGEGVASPEAIAKVSALKEGMTFDEVADVLDHGWLDFRGGTVLWSVYTYRETWFSEPLGLQFVSDVPGKEIGRLQSWSCPRQVRADAGER